MSGSQLSTPDRQTLLFGADPTAAIVAVEARDASTIELWTREGGALAHHTERFGAFLWIAERDLLAGYKGEHRVDDLEGSGPLRHIVTVPGGKDLEKLKRHLVTKSGETASSPQAPYLYIGDRVHLHLLRSGQTLFKGLKLSDLRRLQLDVQASIPSGFEFPNSDRESDRILAIAVTDSDGHAEVIDGDDEEALIGRLAEVIVARDPDVIEGHGLYKFHLDYLKRRAERYRMRLAWGRDGSAVRFRRSRVQVAERTIDYPVAQVYGRHFVDTWLLVQFYDLSTGRGLGGYELADVAIELGAAPEDHQPLAVHERQQLLHAGGAAQHRHHLEDCRQVRELAEVLQASYFIQAQIFPYSYHHVIVRGQATKINALLLREHLRRRHSLPMTPEVAIPIVGGYTSIEETGIIAPIVHCDVSSLYPSLMLAFRIHPKHDELELFLEMLEELRSMRLEAKRAMRRAKSPIERRHLDALQATFKIVINSFYGYLGSPFAQWGDSEAANEVTGKGRELIQMMVEWLRQHDARPVEVDTDGIYFVPPAGVRGERAEEELVTELAGDMPAGIEVEVAGRYRAMLSYKVKNYALLDYEGNLHIAGSGLRSRGVERYLRRFLRQAIHLTLDGRASEIRELYEETQQAIAGHRLHVTELMKTETLSDSLAEYKRKIEAKKRNRGAAYELALAADRDYRPGDQLSYYVTGDNKRVKVFEAARPVSEWDAAHPDENVPYYQQKLTDLVKKFSPVLGVELEGQGGLELA